MPTLANCAYTMAITAAKLVVVGMIMAMGWGVREVSAHALVSTSHGWASDAALATRAAGRAPLSATAVASPASGSPALASASASPASAAGSGSASSSASASGSASDSLSASSSPPVASGGMVKGEEGDFEVSISAVTEGGAQALLGRRTRVWSLPLASRAGSVRSFSSWSSWLPHSLWFRLPPQQQEQQLRNAQVQSGQGQQKELQRQHQHQQRQGWQGDPRGSVEENAALSGFPRAKAPSPLPFVVLHGIGDACKNEGLVKFVHFLANESNANGTCIEIGSGFATSWLMRLDLQSDSVCSQIRSLPHLQHGFNFVGLSQGALIARYVVESCDGLPKVHNFVSIGGPQAGVASTPKCGSSAICRIIDDFIGLGIYSSFVQDNVAPAGYVKIPTELPVYLNHSKFLPMVNNEVRSHANSTFADRLRQLNRIALVKFASDTVLFPLDTAHFGFFAQNTFVHLLPMEETDLYTEDWVGLRSLMEQGRVDFITFPGDHLEMRRDTMRTSIVPYLAETVGESVDLLR